MKKLMMFILLVVCVGSGIYIYFNYYEGRSLEKAKKSVDSKEESSNKINAFVVSNQSKDLQIMYKNRIYLINKNDKINKKVFYGDFVEIKYDGEFDHDKEEQTIVAKDISTGDKNKYKEVLCDEGIFKDYYDKAYNKLKTMSVDEKIGQLFIVRVPDIQAITEVKKYQFGGYILFGRDTKGKTKQEIIDNIKSWNMVSKIPLLIAVDEEGGIVARVSSNPNLRQSRFLSPQNVYKNGGLDAIKKDNIEKNKLLYSLGINVNLAPVADVSTNPNDYIYSRTFGKSAKETGEFVEAIVKSSKYSGVSNVLKHFPGYGNNVDTHTGISIDERKLDEFRKKDFMPFQSGISVGAESVLVSHNIIVNVENNIPASLSFNIHKILRNELKFDGIVMTDDLEMDAIHKYVDKSSLEALKSGNDLIMVSDYASGISEIKEALKNKEISESLIDKSVIRVLAWKYYKHLM